MLNIPENVIHRVVLSESEYRILSADAGVAEQLSTGAYGDFMQYVRKEDIAPLREHLTTLDGSWTCFKVERDGKTTDHCCRVKERDRYGHLVLELACVQELTDAYIACDDAATEYKAILNLYEDVFFEYDTRNELLYLFNTMASVYNTGTVSMDRAEEILSGYEQEPGVVKELHDSMKSGTGYVKRELKGNLVGCQGDVTSTVFEGNRVMCDHDNDYIVGRIHPVRMRSADNEIDVQHDALTGLIAKSTMVRLAKERIDTRNIVNTSLMIIDVDKFKDVNDTCGHAYGDEVLQKVGGLLKSQISDRGFAGRIGGDEFMVIYDDRGDEEVLRTFLRNLRVQLKALFPEDSVKIPITLSIGSARYPQDASDYKSLFALADACLYRAKDKGRNRYIIYTKDKHGTLDDLLAGHAASGKHIGNKRAMTLSELMITLYDDTICGEPHSVDDIMMEYCQDFGLPCIALFSEDGSYYKCWGTNAITDPVIGDSIRKELLSDELVPAGKVYAGVGDIRALPDSSREHWEKLLSYGIYSFIRVLFNAGRNGDEKMVLALLASNNEIIAWNDDHHKYHRMLAGLLSRYSFLDKEEHVVSRSLM